MGKRPHENHVWDRAEAAKEEKKTKAGNQKRLHEDHILDVRVTPQEERTTNQTEEPKARDGKRCSKESREQHVLDSAETEGGVIAAA